MSDPPGFPMPLDLPKPVDHGARDHLTGMLIPPLVLPSTAGRMVDLGKLSASARTAIYCYPMTGVRVKPLPHGWDMSPGARGCTPQSCGFRDHHRELTELGADVFGLRPQTADYQREMVERLHLPFEVLSDVEFKFCEALRLPTFEVGSMRLIKRLTLVVRAGVIETVFYPVFPPNESADQVIRWLNQNPF